MSTEVATVSQTHEGIAPAPFSVGGNLIREAAAAMHDAHLLAKAICNTQMVPAHFRGKPDECAAAMLYGASLGLDPMQAVKGIYPVHGSAALYARTMASIVLRDGHRVWTVESTDESVTVRGTRNGTDHVEESTWTITRAERAGYTKNDLYKTNPQAMLYAKAVSEVCRKIAPDSLNGVYSVEELHLEPVKARHSGPAREVSAASFTRTTTTPSIVVDETTGEVTDAPPTQAAIKAMFAALNARLDTTDRTPEGKQERAEFMEWVLHRPVASSKDLSADDVARITSAVNEGAPQDGGRA